MKARAKVSSRVLESIHLYDTARGATGKVRALSTLLYMGSLSGQELDDDTVGASNLIIQDNLDVIQGALDQFLEGARATRGKQSQGGPSVRI